MIKAKVFLLSNKEEIYDSLRMNGYKDIVWLKTTQALLSYLSHKPNTMDNVDLVIVSDIFYDSKHGKRIYDAVYTLAFKNSIPYIEESKGNYTLLTNRVARTNLKLRDVFNIIRYFSFNKGSNERAPLINKGASSLKVLFIGDSSYFSFVESYFKKQGIKEIKCATDVNIHDEDTISNIMNYDIVISGTNNHLVECVDEFGEYLKDKNHLLFLVNFDLASNNDTTISHLLLANTNQVEIDRKVIQTYKDYNKLYQYIMDVILEEYSKINGSVQFEDIKPLNEILDDYVSSRTNITHETDLIMKKINVIDEIERLSRRFMNRSMKREDIRELGGLRFERLYTGIRITFVHENTILARLTYYTNGKNLKSPYYKEFGLEIASSKGYLMNLGMRSIYDDRKSVIEDAPPVIRNDDYVKIEGIYKRLLVILKKEEERKALKKLKLK